MDETERKKVEALIDSAVNAKDSSDALRYSQAALNAAHAMQVCKQVVK